MNVGSHYSRRIGRAVAALAAAVGLAAAAGCAPATEDEGLAAELGMLSARIAELEGELDRFEQMDAELEDLRAHEEIRALFADYGRTLDDRDFAAFGRLFARDAEFVGGGNTEPAQGPQAIAEMLQSAIARNARGANLHIYSNEKIVMDGDRATATSRGAWVGQDEDGLPTLLIYATYEDELVREDGRWKFRRRRIVGDIPGPPNESR